MFRIREAYTTFYVYGFLFLVYAIVGYTNNRLDLIFVLMTLIMFSILYFFHIRTEIIIKNGKIETLFGDWWLFRSSIDIDKIFKIERIQGHKVRGFLISTMLFRYIDENGKRKRKWIYNEKRYRDKDLKKLLLKLKEINPKIEFNHQYVDLMEGKYDKWFGLSSVERGGLLMEIEKKEKKEIGDEEFRYVLPDKPNIKEINTD